jgi:hypothetical protein
MRTFKVESSMGSFMEKETDYNLQPMKQHLGPAKSAEYGKSE